MNPLPQLRRRAKALPFNALVKEAKLGRATVSGVLSGKIKDPRTMTVVKLTGAVERVEERVKRARAGEDVATQ